MKIQQARTLFIESLQPFYDVREAGNIFGIIHDDMFGLAIELNEADAEKLHSIIHQMQQHVPIQYILGEADFYGLKFKVTNDVLIPRPETEELVYQILQHIKKQPKALENLSILDIGTGSGCIPVTLKKNIDSLQIEAIDVSEKALELAKKNSVHNNAEIKFTLLNFLEEAEWKKLKQYDIIVSNPPYITQQEFDELDRKVKEQEPGIALIAGHENPFVFYELIAKFGKEKMNNDGIIFCELNSLHAETIDKIFSTAGYKTEIIKDLQGMNRMIKAIL